MTRFELIFHAAKGGFTAAGFDAFTDRLADAFPDLEAKHPWLVDIDLAADMATGVVTVGASVEEPDDRALVEVLGGTVIALRGDVEFAYYQLPDYVFRRYGPCGEAVLEVYPPRGRLRSLPISAANAKLAGRAEAEKRRQAHLEQLARDGKLDG